VDPILPPGAIRDEDAARATAPARRRASRSLHAEPVAPGVAHHDASLLDVADPATPPGAHVLRAERRAPELGQVDRVLAGKLMFGSLDANE
jgi:hypothetical protein